MRFNRVFLINPRYPGTYFGAIRPPVGLGYIAESLKKANIEYDVLDMTLGYGLRRLLKRIKTFNPGLVGVSMMTYMYKDTYYILDEIKKHFPSLKIVVGGPHISTLREKALRECKSIDYGVVLEGDEAISELCKDIPLKDIAGLIYREGRGTVFTRDRLPNKELDKFGFPTYSGFELDKYVVKEIDIITSRGCPYECIYCTVKLSAGRVMRAKSPECVVKELVYWHSRGYRKFEFADDNFTFYKKRVMDICDLIEKEGLRDLILRCGNGLRADKLDRELLARMKEVGFRHIALGVESGSNKILKGLRKAESVEVIDEAIKASCDMGFDVSLFFMIGSPHETWDDIEKSVNLALKYPVLEAEFFNLIPYPETELFDWVRKNNYFTVSPEEYLNFAQNTSFASRPFLQTPELSVEDRIKALRYANKIRKKVMRSALRRKLSKFGLLGKFGAWLYTKDFIERIFKTNRKFRRFVEFFVEAV